MEQIDAAAQSILERTGIKIDSTEALAYLGAIWLLGDYDTCLVKIPRPSAAKCSPG